MNDQVVILGGGGHANVVYQLLKQQNVAVLGLVSPGFVHENLACLTCLKSDQELLDTHPADDIQLVNGVGSLPGQMLGCQVYERYKMLGYSFRTLVSDNSIVDTTAVLSPGVLVMNGAVVQAGTIIGENSVLNTGAIVDHDCRIGANNHIGPRAVLCGSVVTADRVYVGAGSNVIHGIKIGSMAVVGAGATVVRDIDTNSRIIPAAHRVESK